MGVRTGMGNRCTGMGSWCTGMGNRCTGMGNYVLSKETKLYSTLVISNVHMYLIDEIEGILIEPSRIRWLIIADRLK